MERTATDPVVGRVLDGRYLVGPRVARGGMATVYEATDLRLDRQVAVKVMHASMGTDPAFAHRFVREARAAARLSHPHVVAVFDQGQDGDTLFLAMEYVPGRTLRDLLREERRLAPARALALLEPVVSALAAAHRAGIVHRDIKPENVLLAHDGAVKVADFGLSRAVSADTQHDQTGATLIGTVSYLAPELVAQGRGDARADVYAAGVMAFELLTGRKPHTGDQPLQVAWKHVHEDVPPPSSLVPGIPAYVDALVQRATARDPSARSADAVVLLHQLHRVRSALEHGVAEDQELTEDLTPTVAPVLPPDLDETGPGETGPDQSDLPDAAARTPGSPAIGLPAQPGPHERDLIGGSLADDAVASRPEFTSSLPRAGAPITGSPVTRSAPPRRRRAALPLLLVLALLVAGTAWWFGLGRYTATPGVVNLAVAEARTQVVDAELGFVVERRAFSETVPAGRVISSDPAGGDRILRDGTVEVVVSRGPERHDVPEVAGIDLDAAQQLLLDASLQFGEAVPRFHPTIPEGIVIRSDPPVGESLRRDAAVDLVLSRGPRPIDVPDLVGKSQERAERILARLELDAEVTEAFDDDVAEGRVVSQDPADGTLAKGDPVALVVSKGPMLVEVPSVIGAGVDAAVAELEAAGFEVAVERSDVYVGLQYVLSMEPGRGTMAPRGSTVTIFLV